MSDNCVFLVHIIIDALVFERNEIQLVHRLACEHASCTLLLFPSTLALNLSTEFFPRTFYFYTNGQRRPRLRKQQTRTHPGVSVWACVCVVVLAPPASLMHFPPLIRFSVIKIYSYIVRLADDKLALLREIVLGNLEVERGGSLSYSAGDVVVRTVARAEPTAVVTSLANGHTTQVGADTQHDKPLRLSGTGAVLLGISEKRDVDLVGLVDLVLGSVSDEDGLASPLNDNVLALGDRGKVNLDLGHGQNVGGSGHVDQELLNCALGTSSTDGTESANHEVRVELVLALAASRDVLSEIGDLGALGLSLELEGAGVSRGGRAVGTNGGGAEGADGGSNGLSSRAQAETRSGREGRHREGSWGVALRGEVLHEWAATAAFGRGAAEGWK
jgi:hypothetical protein